MQKVTYPTIPGVPRYFRESLTRYTRRTQAFGRRYTLYARHAQVFLDARTRHTCHTRHALYTLIVKLQTQQLFRVCFFTCISVCVMCPALTTFEKMTTQEVQHCTYPRSKLFSSSFRRVCLKQLGRWDQLQIQEHHMLAFG